MRDMSEEKLRQMIRVCEMYYSQDLSQHEIAQRLNISRSQISRTLSAARDEGVVKITINNPFAEEEAYSQALIRQFGLRDAVVVNTEHTNPYLSGRQISHVGAAYLSSLLNDGDIISVMAGKSVHNICKAMKYSSHTGIRVVPTIGGSGSEGSDWHANSNAQVLGEKLRSKYYFVNAPSVVTTQENKNAFMREPEIANVLDMAKHSTTALIGIGQADVNSTMIRSGVYTERELKDFKENGAVASVLSWYIDSNGERVDRDMPQRRIGLEEGELRAIPTILAAAYGLHKAEAIHAALMGNWITVLITDITTAKAVLGQ